jgi:hypothetical protein
MSDDAPITSRSGSTGPASDHRNVLIAADRRRRTIPVKALPLVPRAVWVALAGRANEHGIAWPTIDTLAADAGTFTSTVRRALDWLIDVGWITVVESGSPRASARLRVNLEPVPPPAGHAERYPIKPKPRGSGALSEGARSALPGVAERVIRDSGASTEDHRKDHREDPKEDHMVPLAAPRSLGGDGPQAQTTIPFTPSPCPTPEQPEEKPKRTKRPKAPKIGEIARDDLTPAERAIADAITADESLRITVPLPGRTARDLLRVAPDVDIPRKIASLGAWMREKPSNWRPNGATFLRRCLETAQKEAPPRPPPRPDVSVTHGPPPTKLPIPEFIRKGREELRARIEAGEDVGPGEDPEVLVNRILEKWKTPELVQ